MERKGEDGKSRSKWPGLNVVTNFSKQPILPQQATDPGTRKELSIDAKNIPHDAKAQLGPQWSVRTLKSSSSKSRLVNLKRASSKMSNLSPSDRAVVIGISIPSEEAAHHAISPEFEADRGLSPGQYARSRRPSIAPTIVVTPAEDKAPWSAAEEEDSSPPTPRVASSVYSHAPTRIGRVRDSTTVPPVPPLPPNSRAQHVLRNPPGNENDSASPSRVISSCTVFDEDDSPMMGSRGGLEPEETQISVRKRSSTDTIATRYRSQGWWNHIVSPFFPKTPMSFRPSKAELEVHVPRLPNPDGASPPGHELNVQDPTPEISPKSTISGLLPSGRTSWTDTSLEAEGEKAGLTFNHTLTVDGSFPEARGIAAVQDSAIIPAKFEGFGAASEYFEGCLYDMHSTTPYFDCQNHTCLPGDSASGGNYVGSREPQEQSTRDLNPGGVQDQRQLEKQKVIGVLQVPTNRFSAAFQEAVGPKPKQRPESDATLIEDIDTTPEVHEAHAAPVIKASEPVSAARPELSSVERDDSRAIEHIPEADTNQSRSPPVYGLPGNVKPAKKFYPIMPPNTPPRVYEEPMAPEPATSAPRNHGQRNIIPLVKVSRNEPTSREATVTATRNYNDQHPFYRRSVERQTTMADLYPPPRERTMSEKAMETREQQGPRKKEGKSSFILKCSGRFKTDKPMSKKKKRFLIAIAVGLILMIILILALVMTLTRKGDEMQVQSQWLNITGYPPMPTGVSTIAQPDAVEEDSACIHPSTMWSCALPKEQQQSVAPNAPNQPNFRVEIRFQNGTNATSTNASRISKRFHGVANAVSAGHFIRGRLLQIRDAFSSALFTPSPSPPSQEDQAFLGNTTDGIHAPFDGEYTPFFMSFEASTKLPSSRLFKRLYTRDINSTSPFPDLTKAIPPPDTNPDGTASPANLLPFPSAQPIRLYDRGLLTEHYGFYNYFDRSIFLKSAAPLNDSNAAPGPLPDDENGGADENAASARCTWTQTRFLVRIWTNKGSSASLLHGNNNNPSGSNNNATTLSNSSANDFFRPGSFPYPITITLDRHGGNVKTKMVYCYGLDDREVPVPSEKKFQLEARDFGGKAVNPAQGPYGNVNVTLADGGPGGIDGGSGGCKCRWQNWK